MRMLRALAWMLAAVALPLSAQSLSFVYTPTAWADSAPLVAQSGYVQTSTFSHVDFRTAATTLSLSTFNNIFSAYPQFTEIGVYVDGAFYQQALPGGLGPITVSVTLPFGTKTVSLVTGLTSRPVVTGPILGTWLTSIAADAALIQSLSGAPKLLVYGDSIAVGGNAGSPTRSAYPMQLRTKTQRVAVEAWGYRSLNEDWPTAQILASKLATYRPTALWLAIGTNDYGLVKWNAADFGAAYGPFLDLLHAAMPHVAIYAQTPIVRAVETSNTFGNTTSDYRTQIATAVSTRPWVTLVDGTTILTTADLDDGVHPTTAGHAKYAAFIRAFLAAH